MGYSNKIRWAIIFIALMAIACNKDDFLGKKPNTDIVQPKTLDDLFMLLDNTSVMGYNGGLGHLAADEYEVSFEDWQTASATERNSYIWAENLYGGETEIRDWDFLYKQIFYANNVLERLAEIEYSDYKKADFIKGWALFARAYANYDLIRNFCVAFDENTADIDLGIPIRLTAGIDVYVQRSTLRESFQQVIEDLEKAVLLLPRDRPSENLNRPSKLASYSLFARIYLDMRKYEKAGLYADSALAIYDKLIDYNTVSKTSATPFDARNDELILNASQIPSYGVISPASSRSKGKIAKETIDLYMKGDLRVELYFSKNTDGTYNKKRGYNGAGSYIFTGLATDELYLIKAEYLARKGEFEKSLIILKELLSFRYNAAIGVPPISAKTAKEVLNLVLLERRKELTWRGLRWYDLKRLNKEGGNIELERSVNNTIYILEPNSVRYIFPIPDQEIILSGIQQNKR